MFKIGRLEESVPGYKTDSESWTPPPKITFAYHPTYSLYKNMTYVGYMRGGTTYGKEKMYRKIHPVTTNLAHTDLLNIAGEEYYMVKPTEENVNKTIFSLEDRPAAIPFEHQEMTLNYGLDYFNHIYGHLYEDCMSTPEETVNYINFDRSSGTIGSFSDLRTKFDLTQDTEFNEWFYQNKHLDTIPIWSLSPKSEFKNKNDIINNKIRLFVIPPYDLLYEQIRFGKRVSIRFKNFGWSAYGFNPYKGGANAIAQKLASKRVRFFYDVRGWDKYNPLMRKYYNIVSARSTYPKRYHKNFVWQVINTIKQRIKTPAGDVLDRDYANPSGSGITTRDNIGIHAIMTADYLSLAYFLKYNKLPSFELVSQQCIYIFGDDIVGAVDEEFDYITQPNFFDKFFAGFGMSLKYCQCSHDLPITEMEFLGFKFHKIRGKYYPRYDLKRLATSMLYEGNDDGTIEPYISRVFTLMVMSYPHDEFLIFKHYFQELCDYLMKSPTRDYTNTVFSYLSMRNLPEAEIDRFYTGNESSNLDFLYFLDQNVGFACNYNFQQECNVSLKTAIQNPN